ncbi:MAG: hypothetical protein KME26_31095 [Oscillatoria princeps RMCB-10]|nr:hypothetical protein [Oscillatoria princeps RMCB-10]
MPKFVSKSEPTDPRLRHVLWGDRAVQHSAQPESRLVVMEVGVEPDAQTSQFNQQRQISASVVMGAVGGVPAQQNFTRSQTGCNPSVLFWNRQEKTGDRLVVHHLKDDGQGRLSFLRAIVSLKGEAGDVPTEAGCGQSAVPHQTAEDGIEVANTLECIPESSQLPQTPADISPEPSARTAISVGVAINLLAIAVGGYLLQFSTSAQQMEIASTALEQHQAKEAGPEIEAEAQQVLQQAYDRASSKDFAGALDSLKQIPEGTSAHKVARSKMVEYAEKQRFQLEGEAHQLLQTAYSRAQVKDFAGAVSYLQQIPKETAAYTKVEGKLVEYKEKQRLKAEQQWAAPAVPAASTGTPQPQPAPSTLVEISSRAGMSQTVSPAAGGEESRS